MSLQLVNAGSMGKGIFIGGWNIAPDVVLIHGADSFDEAWEALTEHFAEQGSLAECDCSDNEDDDSCDCEWIDSHGKRCTLDVVMRVVQEGRIS